MITVAVVGSREYPWLELVEERIRARAERHGRANLRIVSGYDAERQLPHGVDERAYQTAVALRLLYRMFPADWDHLGKRAGFVRNVSVVEIAEQMDAFWTRRSSGTAHAVELAHIKGIPVFVFGPRGERVSPEECVRWLDQNRPNRQRPAQRNAA